LKEDDQGLAATNLT